MEAARKYSVLASLEPAAAPEGTYFNSGTPDREAEKRYFSGWYNDMTPWGYRNQESHLQVAWDQAAGARVLEWKQMHLRYLLNTDPFVADVRLRARVRVTTAECVRYHDIPDCTESRLGIVLRYEDHRHFYFLALEGLQRLVLYRRDDDEWQVLASAPLAVDPERYYELEVEATGSGFRCACGEVRLQATDSHYPKGRFGLRGNSLGKIAWARVEATAGQGRYNALLRANYRRREAILQEGYPQLEEARRIDLGAFGPVEVEVAHLRPGGRPDLLLRRSGEEAHITAVDWDLNVLWEQPGGLEVGRYVVYRDGPEGQRQLVTWRRDRFAVIDLGTGQTVREAPFPRPVRHRLWDLTAGMAEGPGNVQGRAEPGDLLLRYCDGEHYSDDEVRLMVLDEEFQEIWSVDGQAPGLGHTFGAQFFDVDGDGRDEVLASYQLLSPEGEQLWRMEAVEELAGRPGAGHIDFAVMGNFAGDGELDPTVFACSGGVYVVDGRTGRTRARHLCGHTQGGKIGNFRPDLPGLELAGRNRWGCMGLVPFVNGRGTLTGRMHPDPIGHPSGPVNWKGDGGELVFINSYRGLGLYDGCGFKVVELPTKWCNEDNFKGRRPGLSFADVWGDARQELLHWWDGVLTVYTQDRPPDDPDRVYAPRKQGIVSQPGWSAKKG